MKTLLKMTLQLVQMGQGRQTFSMASAYILLSELLISIESFNAGLKT